MIEYIEDFIKLFINDFAIKDLFIAVGSIVSIIFALVVGFVKYLEKEKNWIIDKHFTTIESIEFHIKNINNKFSYNLTLYKYVLKLFLSKIDHIFGRNSLINKNAFIKILSFSYLYSTLAFILSWFLGGSGSIGSIVIIKSDIPINARLSVVDATLSMILVFILLGLSIYIYYYYKYHIKNKEIEFGNKSSSYLVKNLDIYFILLFFMLISFFMLKNNIKIDVIYFLATILYIFFLLLIVFLPKMILFFFKSFLDEKDNTSKYLIITSTLLLLVLFTLFYEIAKSKFLLIVFIFMVLLPLLNAIFDYISIYISRLLAKKILFTNSKMKISIEIFLDLMVAFGLFFMLGYTLMNISEYLNTYFNLNIPINYYKILLLTDIFDPNVLWITIMFMSTLIPTLIHIFLGLVSIFLNFLFKPHMQVLIRRLKKLQPNDPNMPFKETLAKELVYEKYKKLIKGFYIILILLCVVIILIVWLIMIKKKLI